MSKNESGFFDLPEMPAYEHKRAVCFDPSHEAPTHLHIPAGKGYRHVCPSCGREVILYPSSVRFGA
jgi:predicted RNA-binding Zn-ribbon protein involved in translation (DUF1610 family)